MGNILKETCNGHEIHSTYDLLGRRTHIGSSLGADISQSFDVLGNVAKISLTPTEREGVCGGEASWSAMMDYDRQGLEIQRTLSGGVVAQTKRDRLGRVRFQNAVVNELTTHLWREYDWNYDHRLASITDHKNHHTTAFEYDDRGFLERAIYNRKEQVWRTADKLGNLYQSQEKNDRKYQSAQLQHDGKWYYHYDKEGNLILKTPSPSERVGVRQWTLGSWAYEWNANGSLHKIKRADGKVFTFKYDAFGRRISKSYHRREFLYIWDGNVLLHEIKKDYQLEDQLTTWIFQDFVPVAKLQGDKSYSIISDHIGTPILAVDTNGVKVWERELDIYGKVRKETKENPNFVPFRYQGQYYDSEVDLCYNRFRYYDCNTGSYISQDPIRLAGNNPTLYGYAYDTNMEVDRFGWYNPYPRIKGKFGPNPNPNPQPIKGKIHGNSLQSKELNHLYAKFDEEGNFLKWGKTNDLDGRYSKKELNKGRIEPLTSGNIIDIKNIERELAEKRPGIDNKESWAGIKKGEPLSIQAQEVYDEMLDKMNNKNTCKQ